VFFASVLAVDASSGDVIASLEESRLLLLVVGPALISVLLALNAFNEFFDGPSEDCAFSLFSFKLSSHLVDG
jgi:hypothetical protein